jgi:cellulose synthase/poly-beta-1,6-N-acetylglucosamine synthase-like glycosyltransferase
MLMLLPVAGLVALVVGTVVEAMNRSSGPTAPALPRRWLQSRSRRGTTAFPTEDGIAERLPPTRTHFTPVSLVPAVTRPTTLPSALSLSPPTPSGTPPRSTPDPDREARLRQSVEGLLQVAPEFSAYRTLNERQRRVLTITGVVLAVGLLLLTRATLVLLVTVLTIVYTAVLLFRIKLFRLALRPESTNNDMVIDISDHDAATAPADDLPSFTVLVPAYREGPGVIGRLIQSLEAIDYPRHLLDVKLLLEEDDELTINAAKTVGLGGWIEMVLVPVAEPRTKPKACNFGLTAARGELVTVFDAEDRPEPLQLRKAALAFRDAPPTLACLQAELSYFNPDQNIITRWFTVEYTMWFTQFLPGLTRLDAPVPLGGTSCHFRRSVLMASGAWDPYNVTEDADLGVRLHRFGYRTAVLRSVTMEEANSDFVNWVKQRSRWYKGYLQTWLVHMREPRRLLDEIGPLAFIRFGLFVGGTPILAALNPVFWALTLFWFLAKPAFIVALFPAPLYYLALFCWLGGNFLIAYGFMLTALKMDRFSLFLAAVLVPLYWVMMSLAAVKAVMQLVQNSNYWEKTEHGLDLLQPARRRRDTEVASAS